jgi:glycerol kinase
MHLQTLDWAPELLEAFAIPRAMLPSIRSSCEQYGLAMPEPIRGVTIGGILGDQQAALVGQACFRPGEAKNTYGTGCFLLMNTGETAVQSASGLLTTVAYQIGRERPRYALEGSVAVTGALVQWLRDNLGLIASSAEIEALARSVPDNGGAYFVPAFSGLYAPHWNDRARGIVAGLTRFVTRGHLARAVLEATAFQTWEVLQAMEKDSGVKLEALRVDGGMTDNGLLMQFQADLVDRVVVRPAVKETTALGAAFAAGLAAGVFRDADDLRARWVESHRWTPAMADADRTRLVRDWTKAVQRSLDWLDP